MNHLQHIFRNLFLCGGLALIAGCGLLTPQGFVVEPPPSTQQTPDPYNFNQILIGTSQRFNSLEYEVLFAPQFTYEDENQTAWRRQYIMDRLQVLMADPQISIATTWQKDTANVKTDFFLGDTVGTMFRMYTVVVTAGIERYEYTGVSQFNLRYSSDNNTWTIVYWKDSRNLSVVQPSDRSFFHPLFSLPR